MEYRTQAILYLRFAALSGRYIKTSTTCLPVIRIRCRLLCSVKPNTSKFEELEALCAIVDGEKHLIFDFLSKNGLIEKFNEFRIKKAAVIS